MNLNNDIFWKIVSVFEKNLKFLSLKQFLVKVSVPNNNFFFMKTAVSCLFLNFSKNCSLGFRKTSAFDGENKSTDTKFEIDFNFLIFLFFSFVNINKRLKGLHFGS